MDNDSDTSTALRPGLPRHPWPVGGAFWVAAMLGAASPLLALLFYRTFPAELTHWAFPAAGLALLGLVYRRTSRGDFRRDRSALTGALGAAGLWGLGAVGSGWCCSHHICMEGHRAHPPYPWWHSAMDVGWVLGLTTAALWTRILRVPICIPLSGLTAFLISYRFLFGSLGGMYEWLPL